MKVLVLNCFSRNGLATINSLSPSYIIYGGFSVQDPLKRKLCGLLRARRIRRLLYITSPTENVDGFKRDVIYHVFNEGIDVVIPTGTKETDCLSYSKGELARKTSATIAVEGFDKLGSVTDKWATVCLCKDIGIPVPKTNFVEDYMALKNAAESTWARFPAVLKPTRSFASVGIVFFQNRAEMIKYVDLTLKRRDSCGPWVLQEHIKGNLRDVTSCSNEGVALSLLAQERLMTWYDFGGGGVINRTIDSPQLLEYAQKIIENLKWNGILEFDFIENAYGDFFLLECNPKIWGTTQLTVDSGLNMPQQHVDVFLGKNLRPANTRYKIGLTYKWIFPYCVVSWFNKPLTLKNFLIRVHRTFKKYDGCGTLVNINSKTLSHLLGTVVSRAE